MAIRIADIHEAIHKGVREANKDYRNWSRGWSLADSGVEGLLVSRIAKRIHRYQSEEESMLLEVPYKTCREWAGVNPPQGRPVSTFNGKKRVDIALFNGDGRTKYIVEVKRQIAGKSLLYDDLYRISEIIKQCSRQKAGTMQRAFLAILATHRKGSTVKINNIKRWVKDFIDQDNKVKVIAEMSKKSWVASDYSHSSIAVEIRTASGAA